MFLNHDYLVSYSILLKEDFLVMEEIEEDLSNEVFRSHMTTYSSKMEVSLLNEFKTVASKVSIAQFTRDHIYVLALSMAG